MPRILLLEDDETIAFGIQSAMKKGEHHCLVPDLKGGGILPG